MLGGRHLALTSIFAFASSLVTAAPQASTTLPSATVQNDIQILDLNGPGIVYTGSWVNQSSNCELDSIARRTDNKRADDAKAVIEFEGQYSRRCCARPEILSSVNWNCDIFAAGVRGFELSAEASSRTTGYTVTADAIDFNLGQANNTAPESGSTQCSPVFTYYFQSQGTGGHTIAISFAQLRSAKRELLEERQSFELPWLQINHIK
jgi:hypothetical protein